jgi:cytoskeletal protein CcmA (bactofilin family)
MFELGKKDSEAAQAAARQTESTAAAASAAGARRTGSGQFAVIGRSIQINGDVKGDEDLMIEGDVSGTVELRNHSLTVGKEGKVKANIFARAITVDGTTEGDMYASERIAVRATANVRGNLLAPRVSLEDGARFKGSIEMDQQAVEKALGSTARSGQRAETSTPRPNGDVKTTTADRPGSAAVAR